MIMKSLYLVFYSLWLNLIRKVREVSSWICFLINLTVFLSGGQCTTAHFAEMRTTAPNFSEELVC